MTAVPVSAVTTYTGVGSGSALDIANSGNWNNGPPTSSGNPGTINTNSTVNAATGSFTYTGYYITLTGGTMTQFNAGNDPVFSGGTFTVNGGTYGTSGGRAFRNAAGNVATLTSGTINSGSNGFNSISASTLNVNGGTFQQHGANRNILLTAGSTLTVNGGALLMDTSATATGVFGRNNLATGNNFINLNGGTTTVNLLDFGTSSATVQLTMTVGGTTAGTFTAKDFGSGAASERDIRWLPGSLMTITITNEANWAEIEWNAGRMLYDGQGFGVLGNWATVSGDIFDWDGSTNTLSLIPVPEPAGASLIGIAFGAFAFVRRRPRA